MFVHAEGGLSDVARWRMQSLDSSFDQLYHSVGQLIGAGRRRDTIFDPL